VRGSGVTFERHRLEECKQLGPGAVFEIWLCEAYDDLLQFGFGFVAPLEQEEALRNLFVSMVSGAIVDRGYALHGQPTGPMPQGDPGAEGKPPSQTCARPPMGDEEAVTYRMPGAGFTRLELGRDSLVAGQPRNGYHQRAISLASIEGFCIEPVSGGSRAKGPMEPRDGYATLSGNFILVFRDGSKRRVYHLAVDVDADALHEVVAALAGRCPAADLTRLPVSDALARLQVPSHLREVLKVLVIVAAGLGLLVVVLLLLWRQAQ